MPKFADPIDLNGYELLNVLAQLLGSDPVSPAEGQFWYNSSTKKFMYRDNAGSRDVTYLAQILALRLDQFAAPNTDLSIGSHKLTNLLDGTSAQDAATYGQLQSVNNGRAWKDAVRMASTGNLTLSGLQTVDGITGVDGDSVLAKDQTTGADRGIYIMHTGAWTRRSDADSSAEIIPTMTVKVQEGTVNGDTEWTLTTNAPITLGTTSLTFVQTGTGVTYSQGNGISISGNVIAVDTAVTVRKFAANYGDGSTTAIPITHNLGTKDVMVMIRKNSTDAMWIPDWVATSTNVATITHAVAPTTNEFRAIIFG
jgi:phage-related tail fiber protein